MTERDLSVLCIEPGHGSVWLRHAHFEGEYVVGEAWDDSGRGSAFLPDDYMGEPVTMNFPRSLILRMEARMTAERDRTTCRSCGHSPHVAICVGVNTAPCGCTDILIPPSTAERDRLPDGYHGLASRCTMGHAEHHYPLVIRALNESFADLDVERLARALLRVTMDEPGLLSDVDMLNDPTEGDPHPAAAAIAAAYREDAATSTR